VQIRRLFALTAFASVLAAAFGTASSHAQEWPMRQATRVLIALAPGSAIDLVSRLEVAANAGAIKAVGLESN
jgi:tripartite-type tricarboxylate transporter receptor subunit TctC